MSPTLRRSFYWTTCLFSACAVWGATVNIPTVEGPMTGDGRLDEPMWKSALVMSLESRDFDGRPFPEGGEARVALRGEWLCLGARLPEPGRVVARSVGKNPVWWKEDLIEWTFRFQQRGGRNRAMTLTVNPLGAYRLEYTGGQTVDGGMATASIGSGEWIVEAAIPAGLLNEIGFVWAERVRVARPNAPELHWYWPAANERASFTLKPKQDASFSPAFRLSTWEQELPVAEAAKPESGLAAELASVRADVWSSAEHEQMDTARMVERKLHNRAEEVAASERRDWERVNTLDDWEKFRDVRLRALKASLGAFPERTPLKPVVTRRADYGDGFVLENLVYESRPNLLVTANLYLPSKISGRIPAIVVVHSHHAPKTQSELQDIGMTWARSGVAVLVMDQPGAGERLQSQPWSRESYYSRYAMGMQLHLAGESLMKWMVWDLMRGIDLLLERPYVDPNRIVMLGAVAGGGDPAAVTAALDKRIAVVVPFNFGEAGPEEHYTLGPRGYDFKTAWPGWGEWETTRCLRLSIADQFFPWFICASVAPRGFIYSFEIGWPKTVEEEPPWPRYKKVFELYGKRDRLAEVHGFGPFPGPGECTNVGVVLREKLYPILNQWLKIPVPNSEYHDPRPDSELMCLTPAVAAERNPKTVSEIALGMARERLAVSRAKMSSLSANERLSRLRASLKVKLGDIEPARSLNAKVMQSKEFSGFAVESISLEMDAGITVPMLLLKPQAATGRSPVVVAFAQGGKEKFLAERRSDIAELLKAGVDVCLPDVRGTGETAWSSNRGPGSMSLAVTEFMLGDTMLGARLKDARSVVRYLSGRGDVDSKRIVLWGDSFADVNPHNMELYQSLDQQPGPVVNHQSEPLGSLLALLTALYEDNVEAVAARRGLISYRSILDDRFCYVPQDVIVPGILEVTDISDIVASLAPRGLLIEGFVDGRDRVASESDLKVEFDAARMAYRSAASQLVIREKAGEPGLAAWLIAASR
jgi:cephalosporin-C deacetylase-like acetyl esterase